MYIEVMHPVIQPCFNPPQNCPPGNGVLLGQGSPTFEVRRAINLESEGGSLNIGSQPLPRVNKTVCDLILLTRFC